TPRCPTPRTPCTTSTRSASPNSWPSGRRNFPHDGAGALLALQQEADGEDRGHALRRGAALRPLQLCALVRLCDGDLRRRPRRVVVVLCLRQTPDAHDRTRGPLLRTFLEAHRAVVANHRGRRLARREPRRLVGQGLPQAQSLYGRDRFLAEELRRIFGRVAQ